MAKKPNALEQLADFYGHCQKVMDPEERSKAVAEWAAKQTPAVQRLVGDAIPVVQNIGKRISEVRGK